MIRHLSYRDIPAALRAQKAGEAQRRLQAVLSEPTATAEQRELARKQQGILRHWAKGVLPLRASPEAASPLRPSAPPPQEHLVTVSETMAATEAVDPSREP